MSFSNRMFPTKVVSRWLRSSEEERVQMVMTYFLTCGAGFHEVQGSEIATASHDPLYVVTGRKPGGDLAAAIAAADEADKASL